MNDVFTVKDLTAQSGPLSTLTPPARLAVLGDPVAHSKSPAFQNAALRACGIDAQYIRLHATPAELDIALRALPSAGFRGVNLTIPHKTAAMASLDEIDATAKAIGAVNTVSVEGEKLNGFNTDGAGFLRAIREEFFVDLRDLRVMVLGAGGGAGRSIAVQCALEGCERLILVNRTAEKVTELASELAPYFRSDRLIGPSERLVAIPHDIAALRAELDRIDLLVNASSVGMKHSDPALIPQSLLTANLMVYDAVYAGGKTRLVADAEQAGARAANGLSMLLHQGALAFEIWFNRPAPLAEMRAALLTA
jgi:shikimate dehydrogenase